MDQARCVILQKAQGSVGKGWCMRLQIGAVGFLLVVVSLLVAPVAAAAQLELPFGAVLRWSGWDGAHGQMSVEEGRLVHRSGGREVVYTVATSPASEEPDIEAFAKRLLVSRLGQEEGGALDLEPVHSLSEVHGVPIMLGQTLGGWSIGRAGALIVIFKGAGRYSAIVQETFPDRDSWRANADFLALLQNSRFLPPTRAAVSAPPPRRSRASVAPAQPAPQVVGQGAEDETFEDDEQFRVAFGGSLYLQVERPADEPSWQPIPGGFGWYRSPHQVEVRGRAQAVGLATPLAVAQAVVGEGRRGLIPALTLEPAPELASMLGVVAAWRILAGQDGGLDGMVHPLLVLQTNHRVLVVEVSPVSQTVWRRIAADFDTMWAGARLVAATGD